MMAYGHLLGNPDINMILDTINEMHNNRDMPPSCHGRYHAMFVVDTIEHILKLFSCDSRTIELGKIAALSHDIGNIAGRRNHARKSAALAGVFLDGLCDLSHEEKDIIIQAIADHSDGHAISSAVGAALIIADKVDLSKRRILPVETLDAWHRNLLEIEDVDIYVSGQTIVVNYTTTNAFSQEVYLSDCRVLGLLTRAASYFGCNFKFNWSVFPTS